MYLECWHADVETFLELRENSSANARRTHHPNLANGVSALVMRRVEEDGLWSRFDPFDVPELPDLWSEACVLACSEAETRGLAKKSVKACNLYARMMRTLAQTGNGLMTFKDACNQTATKGNVSTFIHLCKQIVEVTNWGEIAVCNLGTNNLAQRLDNANRFDFDKLAPTRVLAARQRDRAIDCGECDG